MMSYITETEFNRLISMYNVPDHEIGYIKNRVNVGNGQFKIALIKELRENHPGMGLKEAKDIVEGIGYGHVRRLAFSAEVPATVQTEVTISFKLDVRSAESIIKAGQVLAYLKNYGVTFEINQ